MTDPKCLTKVIALIGNLKIYRILITNATRRVFGVSKYEYDVRFRKSEMADQNYIADGKFKKSNIHRIISKLHF